MIGPHQYRMIGHQECSENSSRLTRLARAPRPPAAAPPAGRPPPRRAAPSFCRSFKPTTLHAHSSGSSPLHPTRLPCPAHTSPSVIHPSLPSAPHPKTQQETASQPPIPCHSAGPPFWPVPSLSIASVVVEQQVRGLLPKAPSGRRACAGSAVVFAECPTCVPLVKGGPGTPCSCASCAVPSACAPPRWRGWPAPASRTWRNRGERAGVGGWGGCAVRCSAGGGTDAAPPLPPLPAAQCLTPTGCWATHCRPEQ